MINLTDMKFGSAKECRGFCKLFAIVFMFSVFISCTKDAGVTPTSNTDTAGISDAAKKDLIDNSFGRRRTSKPTTTTPTTTPPATTTTPPATSTPLKASAPISLNGAHDLTISGDSINGGAATCINLINCYNIHVTKCKLQNSTNNGVYMYGCSNILVDSCYATNVLNGALVSTSTGIQILHNSFLNMNHDYVQFDAVYGGGNKIAYNKGENIYGSSTPEDGINIYKSNGTSTDPITVMYNQLRGGGPSQSGGGIVLGDGGGSNEIAEYNSCVNTGQYGIGVGGGTNCQILNNNIYGAKFAWSSNGIEVNAYNSPMNGCYIITISGNSVNWTNSAGVSSPYWSGNNCGAIVGLSTNNLNAGISASIVPAW
jgi:hypothetical protein